MTQERFNERFASDDGVLIIPGDGSAPYRMDGQPLTDVDRALIAGEDPLKDQIPAPVE